MSLFEKILFTAITVIACTAIIALVILQEIKTESLGDSIAPLILVIGCLFGIPVCGIWEGWDE